MGKLLLTAAQETLIVTKAGTNAELLRVFPHSNQSSAQLTCIFPFLMSKELNSFWEEEVSDGEGIDDPMGLFEEEKPLHLTNRKTILAPTSHSG